MTKLAVPIMVQSAERTLDAAARAAEFGADLVELRVDHVADQPALVTQLVAEAALPSIVTCRPSWEGGGFEGDEADRLALWQALAASAEPPAYVDVELAAWQSSEAFRQRVVGCVSTDAEPDPNKPGLIISTHDFQSRPADLLRRLEAMASEPHCRVIKLAYLARSLRDNLELFELMQQQVKPMIGLCMGEFGVASRVLAKKFGGLLTFASLGDEQSTASGQVPIAQMKQQYRWDQLTPATPVYGVIGYPVAHSMSPALHNAGFDAVDHNAVYLPLPIHAEYEQFKATVGTWLDEPGLQFNGASVTIPHKQNLLRFVTERGGMIDPLSESIGAANTLARLPDGQLYACNTDYAAALDAVCAALNIERAALAGRRIAIIGAGGAARALVAAFAHYGATVVVYNRTVDKAQQLVDRFDGHTGKVVATPLTNLCKACCDVFVNCTPIGMHPETDVSPLDDDQTPANWDANTLVFDTIYNPTKTRLLSQAEAAGCQTLSGLEMFVRQAAAQFELWTQKPAPLETFRQMMHRHLGAG
jgi:3-dehydroquinate dehydratase/shikimate dehydrogenase